ncbi:MAG: hypothetical protein AUH41_10405 [Gemmatimonadetes bacterium 13_1_40CM_66_11]|nr:MAG: hypothetical protein AUH41_10405 [Gemmatimonadetes bacterium 13_1_40CM_66_11]
MFLRGDVLRGLTVTRRRRKVLKDPRGTHDMGLLGMRERDLNDLDSEERGIRGGVRRSDRTTRELVRRTNGSRAGDVDVHVVGVVRLRHDGMCVGAAARLHIGDMPWVGQIGRVEDADAAQPVMADGIGDALRAAVGASVQCFAGDEEEIAVHRDVAL